jgi:hypothetical protein
MSLFGRVLRPVVLLVAGMLVAHATLSITTSPTAAATTQTRVASCSGLNFHPIDDRTEYAWKGAALFRRSGEGDGWFVCDPGLPHRSVVTKVRFTVRDTFSGVSVQGCALRRTSLGNTGTGDATIGASQTLGTVPATGLDALPGTVRLSDPSISRATIDNAGYSYFLGCQIYAASPDFFATEPHGAIIGADVTYRISSTNG